MSKPKTTNIIDFIDKPEFVVIAGRAKDAKHLFSPAPRCKGYLKVGLLEHLLKSILGKGAK